MKKKANLQPVRESAAKEVRARRTGPVREKTQVTLRIDQKLMDSVMLQIKEDNQRITDAVEQGLMLWLKEARQALPKWTTQVRFMVANATREQEKLLRGLLVAMVEGEVKKKPPVKGEDWEREIYDFCCRYLLSRNESENAAQCLESYSRYGKTAEEIAKLG